ncbi:hypothetical protein CP97_14740 [Aurantiacibacter atlanticus]|uniref:Uncharacterized protein n=1 Tax=Aurantiacibacter atlanticus TaxID=1648404 RepID=A0A168M1R7_9SPHN|nr:hypothetical protein CP97_14740 [Aurantiacibacter atlanticus]
MVSWFRFRPDDYLCNDKAEPTEAVIRALACTTSVISRNHKRFSGAV